MTQGHLEGFGPPKPPPPTDGTPPAWGSCPGCGVMGWRHPGRACPGCGWSPEDDLALGRQGRDEGLDKLEASAMGPLWLVQAKAAAKEVARRNGRVCADDIHRACPIPEGVDPRIMGAVFRGKEWEPDGIGQTTRPEAHARWMRWWRLKPDQT